MSLTIAVPRPPPEAVEGMAWVPGAGRPRYDGRQGVRGLVVAQGGGAVRQGHGRREHGADGLQAPVALLRVRGYTHLVVVAIFQHDHGMVLGSRSRGGGAARAVSGYRAARLVRLLYSCAPCHGLSRFPMPPGLRAEGCGGFRVSAAGMPASGLQCWARAWGLSAVL